MKQLKLSLKMIKLFQKFEDNFNNLTDKDFDQLKSLEVSALHDSFVERRIEDEKN
jgi:hypothetical protein|tara:strand:+ start:2597 stop:2761 length:165 start_codon:yes stop_codon:yes gene_type:complete